MKKLKKKNCQEHVLILKIPCRKSANHRIPYPNLNNVTWKCHRRESKVQLPNVLEHYATDRLEREIRDRQRKFHAKIR